MPAPPPPPEKRWKKGQSGNPQGGRKHNPEMKKLKSLTEAELIEVGTLILKGNLEDIKAIPKDPNAGILKCMIAAVAIQTIKTGESRHLDALLNRMIGKVKEKVEHSGAIDSEVTHVDPKLLKEALKKAQEDV